MNDKKWIRSCLMIGIVVVVLALVIFSGYRYMTLRVQANTSPPQVLIHRPTNQGTVYDGSGTLVHATVRAESGITRAELWVDGELIHIEEPPGAEAISPLVLHTFWLPKGVGLHEIVVKAVDAKQVTGVGSILVRAETADETVESGIDPLIEAVEGADTPVSDAPAEPAAEPATEESSPGNGGSAPAPPAGDLPAPPASDEEAPPSTNPSTEFTLLEFFFGGLSLFNFGDDEEAPANEDGLIMLTLEGLGLQTDSAYEGVHCYIGMGGNAPRWFPDADLNQATDESFAPTGDGGWNVADVIGEGNGIPIGWPNTDPIPLSFKCIATTGGGTEAVDLGIAEIISSPDEWDGITRNTEASAEGSFRFSYRITQTALIPKGLDPTIPVPTNLRINDRRQELEWDWEDTPDNAGAGVTGFLIYVNDVLVFKGDGRNTRAVRIPYAWFSPPCRTEYNFTVRAYKHPYPDGDYSDASEPVTIPDPADPPRTDCQPEFILEFTQLRTGALTPDNRDNNWAGYVGPISGSFFSNGESTLFQGYDLRANSVYNLESMTWESAGLASHLVVEPTPEEYLTIGFDLGEYVGFDGFNDICRGTDQSHSYNSLMAYGFYEGTIYSYEEADGVPLCSVDYVIRPMEGSPLGAGPEYFPLPWLDITGIWKDPSSGNLHLNINNRGSAPWVNQDLYIKFVRRYDAPYSRSHNERGFVLEVGETKILTLENAPENLWDICYILDPDEEVLELYENTGALAHASMRYCLPRPDLGLHEVIYDFESNTLRMRIWNTGEYQNSVGNSDFNLADLIVEIDLPGDLPDYYSPVGQFGSNILRREEGIWVEWALSPAVRENMEGGYTVRLDPLNTISETNEDNNAIEVLGGKTLRVVWNGIFMRWYPDSILYECPKYGRWSANDYEVWVNVSAQSESTTRQLQSWHYEGETQGDEHKLIPLWGWDAGRFTTDVYLNGEENLVVSVRGEQARESLGSATGYFEPSRNWVNLEPIHSSGTCTPDDDTSGGDWIEISPSNRSWGLRCGHWYVYINRCEIISDP